MNLTYIAPLRVTFNLQQSEDYCGSACLQMVLEYYEVSVDQGRLFRLANRGQGRGTSAQGLAWAASQCGRQGEARAELAFDEMLELLSKDVPVIAFVKPEILYRLRMNLRGVFRWFWQRARGRWRPKPPLLHAIVIIGWTGGEVIFHDPGLPKRLGENVYCPVERFLAAWEYPSQQPRQAVIIR